MMDASGIPERAKPLLHALCAHAIDGASGVRRAVRARTDGELEQLAVDMAYWIWESAYLAAPPPGGQIPRLIFDAAQAELARRNAPAPPPTGSWIQDAKLRNRVEDVAARFTELRPAGTGKLKGRCPMHQERTPSFYVFVDHQRWRCFGACAAGGDVIDLAKRLGIRL